ncbi:MAG TPA: hypothetical protein ENK23_00320 [Sorangium sp.]|nr:hypothetical protein [Sorangium sp.]
MSDGAGARDAADAALDRLVEAYRKGDYAYVREHAPALAAASQNERVRAAATDLRRRIEPAPVAALLWALGTALLLILFGYYLSRSH